MQQMRMTYLISGNNAVRNHEAVAHLYDDYILPGENSREMSLLKSAST